MPFTLRLIFYAMRSASKGFVVFMCGWLFLVPVNIEEREALGLPAHSSEERPFGLLQMRVARAMLTIAPKRTVNFIAEQLGDSTSPLIVEIALRSIAAGNLPNVQPAQPSQSERSIDGPKFIGVDQQ